MQAHGHPAVPQVIAQGFNNLLVGKLQQLGPLFDQRYANAEGGEHAGVFDANDAAANHDKRPGQVLELKDLVAVDDGASVDRNLRGLGGSSADSDDDIAGFVYAGALPAFDADVRRV